MICWRKSLLELKTSSTKVVQYASTQWLSLTSSFNLAILLYVVFVLFKLHNPVLQQLFIICIVHAFHHNETHKMSDHIFQMSSSIFLFSGKMYTGKELLPSHGMHSSAGQVKIECVLKISPTYRRKPKCTNSSATNSDKPSSPECDTSQVKHKKSTLSVPPAQPDKLKLSATEKENSKCANS